MSKTMGFREDSRKFRNGGRYISKIGFGEESFIIEFKNDELMTAFQKVAAERPKSKLWIARVRDAVSMINPSSYFEIDQQDALLRGDSDMLRYENSTTRIEMSLRKEYIQVFHQRDGEFIASQRIGLPIEIDWFDHGSDNGDLD